MRGAPGFPIWCCATRPSTPRPFSRPGTRTPIAQVAISLAEAEAGSIAAAAPALEDHHQGLVSELRAQPYLTRFPASIDPSPFADTVRYHEPRETPGSLPDWWRGSNAPLIYMTFGTVLGYMSIAAETYRMALEAVKRTNARVLLTVGRRFDASILGPVPPNVHLEPWINQARVLDHADLVVCHGGSGTTLAALAAGVPLVIVPLFADQFENARRIGATRAGRVVETQIRTGTAEATQSLGANTSFRTTFSRVRLSRVDDWLPEPRRNETKRDEADSLR
jgi:hypothetical protein